MATIVGTVPGLQQCHQPLNIAHLLKKIKGSPPKVKSFPNTATYQKLLGEFFPPPSPACTTMGVMNLRVIRGVTFQRNYWEPVHIMITFLITCNIQIKSTRYLTMERILKAWLIRFLNEPSRIQNVTTKLFFLPVQR